MVSEEVLKSYGDRPFFILGCIHAVLNSERSAEEKLIEIRNYIEYLDQRMRDMHVSKV